MLTAKANNLIASMKAKETYDLPSNWKARGWQDLCMIEFRKRHRLAKDSYFSFLVSAGVGSGKTILSALATAYLLNKGSIDRIVYVCPNRTIRTEVIKVYRHLNIELVKWDERAHRDGEPDYANGVILTYTKLMLDYKLMGRLCDERRTLVIFDEIHHLGDKLPWGDGARSAFEDRAACILGLSGTPYRGDNRPIPFVEYQAQAIDGLRVFEADYTYTLGRAIHDGVCRMPNFKWGDGTVRITLDDGTKKVVDWEEKLAPHLMNRRLNNAVRHGSKPRLVMLQKAVEYCRRTHRKLIIFVGGDSRRKDGGGIRDAMEFLPAELKSIGVDPRYVCTVVSDDELSHDKLAAFGESEAQILIAVNMVSEGVDIPQLSAALFLTSITARSTTIQRIGRILRGDGEAVIFMFGDERYKDIAQYIHTQINHEIDMGKAVAIAAAERGCGGPKPEADPKDIGLTYADGGLTVNGTFYPPAIVEKYYEVIASESLPESQAFKAVLFPLILKGAYGPINLPGAHP